jgi:hypothetical protein
VLIHFALGALLGAPVPPGAEGVAAEASPASATTPASARAPATALTDGRRRVDAPVPPPPEHLVATPSVAGREVGTPTTLFVNFDGVNLGECNPSNSQRNCHWYNTEEPIPAFSGSLQAKVSVLQAMRHDTADFGIRITALRPPAGERYTMVVYGGTEARYGALGSAPAGDCLDQLPNEIAFAHLDGELAGWVNGGATTALHEAGHTWGLDHVDADRTIMYPTATDDPAAFGRDCYAIVADVALEPGEASCPELNMALCGQALAQNAAAALQHLFGGPYVDVQAPTVKLVAPADGQYFQAPASFDVVLDIRDDLHPQVYDAAFWLNDDPKPEPRAFLESHFSVVDLPIGTWVFHVEFTDQAGNTARLDFEIEVGEDPPPPPAEGGCAVGGGARGGVSGRLPLVVLLLPALARRRGPR